MAGRLVASARSSRARVFGERAGLLVLPAALCVGALFLYPVGKVVGWSFTNFQPPQSSGFDNYRWFVDTSVNLKVLHRTVETSLVVTLVCVVLSYPYAYLMTNVSRPWRLVMLAFVLLPFWTSVMARNFAWVILLQDHGVVNQLLGKIGLGPYHLLGNVKGVTIGMAQVLLPYMVLPLYSVLQRIDPTLIRAAEGLGATPRAAFVRVYVPLSLPGLLAGGLLVFVLSLGFFITPAMLGSPQDSLLSQLIVSQVGTLLAWGRGGAMAVVLLVVTLALLWIGSRATRGSLEAAYASPTGDDGR